MRILLTADPELPVPPRFYGGIERVVDLLVRGLRDAGHCVALCAHADSSVVVDELFAWPGQVSQDRRAAAANVRTLVGAVRRWQPDVLHSFSRLAYLLPILPTRLPKIMSYQRSPSMRTTVWARRLAFGSLTFTGCSESICRLGRRGGGDWRAIPNFVDLSQYDFRATVAADAPLVFLSRVEEIKGAHLAIEIARRSGRRLLIAGNRVASVEGDRYWREQIVPHLVSDGVEYVGPVDDAQKNALLGAAAAMVVPIGWDEPFGIVFAESLACGTPIISCPRGSLPEIVETGTHGFLINDADEGAAAVGQLYQIDRFACRRQAEDRFSSAVVVGRYEALYHDRIGRTFATAVRQ